MSMFTVTMFEFKIHLSSDVRAAFKEKMLRKLL